ncbi:MAG: tetratricopeptide repeat protein [Planctomycetota bacterium]|nr:MAG: tetratricopeptide repeat protein [Planctomycetota bacterium]
MIALLLGLLLGSPFGPPDLGQAERDYRAGRFEAALTLFEAALSAPDAPQGGVLYDMGNCAFRLGRHAEAIWHYRRAALRIPNDPEVRFNLRLAQRELGLAAEQERWLSGVFAPLDSLPPWGRLFLVGAVQATGLAGLVLARRRSAVRAGLLLLALLGLLGAARLAREAWFAPLPEGVVLAATGLRAEPSADRPVTLALRPGETVRVSRTTEGWVKVESPRGRGWTESAGVGVVD